MRQVQPQPIILLDHFHAQMFCDHCLSFWSAALAKACIPETIERPGDVVWATHETILHAKIRELRQASHSRCRICRIIYSSLTRHEHATLLQNYDEPLNVVLKLDPAQRPLPLLRVEFREAAGDGVRIPKRVIASCHSILGVETGPRLPGTIQHSADDLAAMLDEAARLNNDHTGSDGALQLASYWVRLCVNTHDGCRPAASRSSATFLPTRLLDVSNNTIRLIETRNDMKGSMDRRYLALSHCWGPVPIIRTMKDNYKKHKRRIPSDELSKTFREATHVTCRLGFRYIWIDSLCIIQDDNDDWAAEAALMCDVYQHATVTIAAAHAPNGDVGCFTARDGLRVLPFYVDCHPAGGSGSSMKLQFTAHGGLQSQYLSKDPVLYGRAWVLQEQLLSPRMLIFEEGSLKWECLTMRGSERQPTAGSARHGISQSYIRSGIRDCTEFFDPSAKGDDDFGWGRIKHQYWCELVTDYTHRGMTKPEDRLAALAGIGQALARYSKSEYLSGLWSKHLFLGLLWSIPHNQNHYLNITTGFDTERNKNIRHRHNVAPSWSWASVTAPIMYAQNALLSLGRVCDIQGAKISGSVASQTGHVTIRGHTRRGYVNAIYPYSIREAAAKVPHLTCPRLEGLDDMTFRDRLFNPDQYFLFSELHPDPKDTIDLNGLRREGPFRLVRGTFRPDEVIDPIQEIMFLAVAQLHTSERGTTAVISQQDYDPIQTYTLALIPTENGDNTYRRIGLAIWEDCAWYGYLCGYKDSCIPQRCNRKLYKEESIRDTADGKLCWDDLEYYKVNGRDESEDCGRWRHKHEYESDHLPDLKIYNTGTQVEEKTVVIA